MGARDTSVRPMIRAGARMFVAGLALEGSWLYAYESYREPAPVTLAVLVLGVGTLFAAAWSRLIGRDSRPWWLAVALVAVDLVLDLISPYPRRFGLLGWEIAKVGALCGGWLIAAGLPAARWWRIAAGVLAGASLVLALA